MRALWRWLSSITLTQWIFIGLVAGFMVGAFAPGAVPLIKPFRGLFLNGIKCIIAPLLFGTLVTGIAGSGSAKQLGRMGVRAFIYFEVVTTLALVFGLLVVNFIQPGRGIAKAQAAADVAQQTTARISFGGFVEHLLPSNIVEAVGRGDVLQLVIFTTIFAVGVLAVGEKAQPILRFCEALSEVMFKVTGYLMWLAPLGVGAAMAASIAEHGWGVIVLQLKLVGSLYLALALFLALVLLPVARLFRVPLGRFYQTVKEPVVLAFATASSESALPMALERMERFGVPRRIVSFILPMGYSFNLDGSTLYLAVASVFAAQAVNVTLPATQQLLMMGMLMLTTKGVAAVPRASLVVLTGTLTTFGLPLEGVGLILGVDALMDMARTAVNLLGNCLATAVVARWEGVELPSGPLEESVGTERASVVEAAAE